MGAIVVVVVVVVALPAGRRLGGGGQRHGGVVEEGDDSVQKDVGCGAYRSASETASSQTWYRFSYFDFTSFLLSGGCIVCVLNDLMYFLFC